MILHSPTISGSLTFADGGTFTLPDNGVYSGSFSGSIQVHQAISSILPSVTNTFDLGSPDKQWRDIYLSSASLYIDGTPVLQSNNSELIISTDTNQSLKLVETGADTITLQTENGDITLATTGTGNIELDAPIQIGAGNKVLSSDGNNIHFGNGLSVTGSIALSGDVDGVDVAALKSSFDSLNGKTLVSGSSQISADQTEGWVADVKTRLNAETVISGSSQVQLSSVSGFSDYSSSVLGTVNAQKDRIDAILASSDADKDSFAEIVSLINSVDTTNDNAFASFYTSSVQKFDSIHSFTSSIDSTIKIKLDAEEVLSGSAQVVELLPVGVVSGSSQVSYVGLSNIPSGIVSGSVQVLGGSDIVSSSAQIDSLGFLKVGGDNVISGSSQVSFSSIVDKPTLVSGSSQVDHDSTTGFVSNEHIDHSTVSVVAGAGLTGGGDITTSRTLNVVSANDAIVINANDVEFVNSSTTFRDGVKTKLNLEGVISSSAQITITESQISDLDHYTDTDFDNRLATKTTTNLSEGTNLYYTDARVKTKLNVEGVTSGSAHILALVSIDEDEMTSNSATKLPTQQSVKTYVDSKVAGLVDSAPGALDTLNELAAALGDDANFATTISTTIGGKVSQSLQIISGNGLTGGGNLTTDRTLNVVGTADRISVSADAVDIASTYVGQTSITTLGTISTGTWNGSVIASAYLDADTAHLSGTQTFTGAKTFSDSTASTTKTTGAVIVTGGVGIGGALNVGGDVVAYASSDKRLKDNIQNIENPIEKVQKLNGVTWDWNSNADELQQSLPNVGVIAQEVEEVFPQLVHDRDNGYKGVDYAKLTGLLIEAIKEQQKQIDELKSRLG